MDIAKNWPIFALIIIDIILVIVILLQQREGGLSSVFGGEGNVYRSKRGLAKGLHYLTIVLTLAFVGLSIALIFINR